MKKEKMKFVGSLALVGLIGAGATLAYLTDNTGTITNTFTAGKNIDIQISETRLTEVEGETGDRVEVDPTTENRTQGYNDLLPGQSRAKDPRVDFINNSNRGYAYLYVDGLDSLESLNLDDDNMTTQDFVVTSTAYGNYSFNNGTTGWFKIANKDGSTTELTNTLDGIYVYKDADGNVVFDTDSTTNNAASTPALFDSIMINSNVEGVKDDKTITPIVLKAAAVQPEDNNANNTAIDLLKDNQ